MVLVKNSKQLMLVPVKTATHSLRSRAKHFKNALADTIKMQISKKKKYLTELHFRFLGTLPVSHVPVK